MADVERGDVTTMLDEPLRTDETHKRLLDWSYGQPPSERLAAQILDAEGYRDIDPSHPLGGPDGGRDGECARGGEKGVWAVYFPRGQQSLADIHGKLKADFDAAAKHEPEFLAFVTNQELRLAERKALRALGGDIEIVLLHLERVAGILDRPHMASVREQFLCIPAIKQSPPARLKIRVSIVGSAHAFTDDAQLMEAYVGIREQAIRKRSEGGHERVRKEREAKEREERTREAERVRRAQERPWDPSSYMPRMSDLIGQGALNSITLPHPPASEILRIAGVEPPKPPEPLSEREIQQKVAAYRSELEARWLTCRDYLASVAWPALRLRIANEAESFPTNVQVIVTFRGARGVRFKGIQSFEFGKVENPERKSATDPRFGSVAALAAKVLRPADYPIEWRHNDDGDLVITVTLPELRPHPEWRSEHHGDDVVLVVDPDDETDQITVSYSATAHGYGKEVYGGPFTVPVERANMRAVLRAADTAAKEQ